MTLSDEEILFFPCEALADKIARGRPEEAKRLYNAAAARYRINAIVTARLTKRRR
jgi:hypothetical protein